MLREGILSASFLNTERAFQVSRKQSSKNNSPTCELDSYEELCIQTWLDHCLISKHKVNESWVALPCNNTLSALLSVLLLKWLMQAVWLAEEDETVFGVSQ